ncbi:MAG TPA: sodium-dependent transporter, partial [Candidatus Saccharimonadales bacterium]|nr:sodium-dependent transporter [Candidatus Saccharimonadales bacterium]
MVADAASRGKFGSNVGFILAAAGSAIGLGNIWGFPYMAAQSGGGAFVLLYLIAVGLIGVPVLLAELSIGRATQCSPVGAFARLAPRSAWPLVGALGVATGFAILAFYSVVAGWTVGYLFKALTFQFESGMTHEQSQAIFQGLSGSAGQSILWTAVFMVLTILVVRGGIQGGIERASKILMPVFFLLMLALVIRAVTLSNASGGIRYLFHFDLSAITPTIVLNALAQALFSLSLGMGAMITYGSYLSHEENLVGAGITVALADTSIALMAGLMIFPAIFHAGAQPAGDEGLVFVVLPTIFDKLPAGNLFAIAFYALLLIAALTSSISLLEVVVSYFVDERQWSREKSTWLLGIACFLLAVPCAASDAFMGIVIQIFYIYALAIGALLICVFTGWRWGTASAVGELRRGGGLPGLGGWAVLIRWVCPVVAALIVGTRIWGLVS